MLQYVAGSSRVMRHVRPKLSFGGCSGIARAVAPSLLIRRDLAGRGLLARVDAISEKQLNDLADELAANDEALKAGINNLRRETEKLENVV